MRDDEDRTTGGYISDRDRAHSTLAQCRPVTTDMSLTLCSVPWCIRSLVVRASNLQLYGREFNSWQPWLILDG